MGGQRQKISVACSATKHAISIKLATTIGHFVRDLDLDFANVLYGLTIVPSSSTGWRHRRQQGEREVAGGQVHNLQEQSLPARAAHRGWTTLPPLLLPTQRPLANQQSLHSLPISLSLFAWKRRGKHSRVQVVCLHCLVGQSVRC